MNRDTAKIVLATAAQVMALEPTRADALLETLRSEVEPAMADVVDMAFKAGYSTAKTDVMALLATVAEEGM